MSNAEKTWEERERESYERAIQVGKRLGCRPSEHFEDWWISWSPRNDNQNAEGPWDEWVALAHAILAADDASSEDQRP